jgi:ATP-binding cassette, subfamily B, bacterial PglK
VNFLSKLLRLFSPRERVKLALVAVILFFGSLLEVAGIGILLPFIKIIGDTGVVLNNHIAGPWLNRLGVTTEKEVIVAACIGLLIFFFFKSIYTCLSLRISYRFTYGKILSLARGLLDSYLNSPFLFHLQHNTAQLVRNITTETELIGGILKFCIVLPTELLVVTGLLVLLLVTQPAAALVSIALLGLLVWALSSTTRKRLAALGKTRSEQHGRMIQGANQALGAVKEVKLLGRERFFVDTLGQNGRKYVDALWKSSLLTQYPRVIIEAAAALSVVVLVLFVVLSGHDVKTLVGVIALFGLALARLVPSASRIMNSVNSIRFYSHSIDVVVSGLEMAQQYSKGTATIGSNPVSFTHTIKLENVSYQYPKADTFCIENVTLQILRGQRVAFVGSSGAGKTTLANLVLGLLEPTSGRILVDGTDIQTNLHSWQRHFGYIPQDIYLTDDTIRRNVAFGLADSEIEDTAIWEALEAAQLGDFVRGLEGRLDAAVGERGVRISAGQRQRIGIARALYHNPAVLVLDEATSALDNETERSLSAAINALPRSKTLIIIAHRITTVQRCDRIFLFEQGHIGASGSYTELLGSHKRFYDLVHGVAKQALA